ANGGESKRLSETPNHEERPRFSPDGKRLIWTSKATDPTQIWMCDFNSDSGALVGKPHQVTDISTGADGGIWSTDGKNIVFMSAGKTCTQFRRTARSSLTRATSTKSKRPARTTKFSSCRWQEVPPRKFLPVPVLILRRFIRRTENSSPGGRKPAPGSKPISGG